MHKIIFILLLLSVLKLVVAASPTPINQTLTIDKHTFRAISVSPDKISLHWKDKQGNAYRSFGALKSDLKKQGKSVVALMNAGIYTDTDEPAGLHIESGKLLKPLNTHKGKGNFHLQPNGVFFITNRQRPKILTTTQYKKRYGKKNKGVRLATQSGPMLLINGKINARFVKTINSPYSRNAVCTTPKGKIWFLITDNYTRTNFYTFAKAAKKLGCYQALYLDGSISKLYQASVNSSFHFSHYVGILAVTE